jgi:hypothetical protein
VRIRGRSIKLHEQVAKSVCQWCTGFEFEPEILPMRVVFEEDILPVGRNNEIYGPIEVALELDECAAKLCDRHREFVS